MIVWGSLISASLLLLAVWKLPQRQASILKQRIEREEKIPLSREKLFELENITRDNYLKVIQSFGGLGFILTGYFTWRNLQAAEKNREFAERKAAFDQEIAKKNRELEEKNRELAEKTAEVNRRLTEDKQVSERFSKAVELLSETEKLEARIGGIYLLERIAKDFPDDHPTVMEVLTAYIREKSPVIDSECPTDVEKSATKRLPEDIQAALTVIGRRETRSDQGLRLNLNDVNLSRAIFSEGANFERATFNRSNLNRVVLRKANLSEAYFVQATLIKANLGGSKLNHAVVSNVDLSGATISGAEFKKAIVLKAKFEGAYVGEADFQDASNIVDTFILQSKDWRDAFYSKKDREALENLDSKISFH